MHEQTLLRKPASRISPAQLPPDLSKSLTATQRDGLAFACRDLRVTGSKIQTFQIGSKTKGSVQMGGLGRSLGSHWAVFGTVGNIDQQTANVFKTDVQIKLEDPTTGEKVFLNYSLPFAITLSVDLGETLRVYFGRGGLEKPAVPHDFRLSQWEPFAAQVLETGQTFPIAALPSLKGPPVASPLLVGLTFGAVGFGLISSGGGEFAYFAYGLMSVGICVALVIYSIVEVRNYREGFRRASAEVGQLAL